LGLPCGYANQNHTSAVLFALRASLVPSQFNGTKDLPQLQIGELANQKGEVNERRERTGASPD
jgi:hypothetical protein